MSFVSRNESRLESNCETSTEANTAAHRSAYESAGITHEYFSNAYQKGFPSTLRFLVSRGIAYEVALDTAQSAWTRGWERRQQLRQPNLLVTWTNSIALNIYRNMLRRERQTEPLQDLEAPPGADMTALEVERILTDCKPKERIVLEEHYIYGYSIMEIAHLQGCSEIAVRVRLFRARNNIKRQVAQAKAT